MALHTMRWIPDSCGCVILYQWDDATTTEDQWGNIAANAKAAVPCAFHQGLANHLAVHNSVFDENARVQGARTRLLAILPAALIRQAPNLDGTTTPDFNTAVTFSLTGQAPNRVLNISIPSLTQAQRAAAQAALDTRFGVGKVIVS